MAALVLSGACGGTSDSGAGTTTAPAPSTTSTSSTSATTLPPVSTTSSLAPTTSTTVPVHPLAGRIIVIDPGHNGQNHAHLDEINRLVDIGNGTKACNTTGTSTNDGYPESRFNWETALLVRERLVELGASVVLTREDDDGWGPCIDERAAIGNRAGADAVISIHADGGPESGRGFHVIHPAVVPGLTDDIAADSLRLAEALRGAYLATGMPVADYLAVDGLSERSDLGGLNLSDVPAVFLEAGNMRNPLDVALLLDRRFRQAIARAVGDALVEFLG